MTQIKELRPQAKQTLKHMPLHPIHTLPYTLPNGTYTQHPPYTHPQTPMAPNTPQEDPRTTFSLSTGQAINTFNAQTKDKICLVSPWRCPRQGYEPGDMMGPLGHPFPSPDSKAVSQLSYSDVKRHKKEGNKIQNDVRFEHQQEMETDTSFPELHNIERDITAYPNSIEMRRGPETVNQNTITLKTTRKTETVTKRYPAEPQKTGKVPECPAGPRSPIKCPIVQCCKGVRTCRDMTRAFQRVSLTAKLSLFAILLAGVAKGSEFPDRECCDSVPPPPPNYHQATSTTTTTTPPPLPGQNNTAVITVSHGMSGVINCIEARHRCRSDAQCRDVLDMLHKICGPELVACATVTPGKCKTLLRTLGKYDFMRTCTCREPHIDFNCYTFREMIFNHPCSLVETPDEHQTYMQTCTEADADCKNNMSCFKNYMEFINFCGYSGITCTSQQSEKCNESWQRIRTTPRFGCYCPVQARAVSYQGGYDSSVIGKKQEKCMNFYNDTHENPCLAGQKDVARAKMVETTQAMCHVALEHCINDVECERELNNINTWCDHSHCESDRCRNALQEFYQRVKVVRRLQVAFCVCRQSDHDGECLMAMRRLHPTCAERRTPKDPMQCHKIAEQCRQNRVCSAKLQQYEQKCAADAMTGLCSDTHRSCQQAVMNILGTELHATCICKGTDFLHQQDCYTWQKLLWSNPCVIESHLKLHEEINNGAAENLDEEFRSLTTAPPTSTVAPQYGPTKNFGNIVYHPKGPSLGPQTHDPVDPEPGWGGGRRTGIQIGQNRGFEPRGTILKYDVPVYQTGVVERPPYPEKAESHFGRGRLPGVFRPTKVIPHNTWLTRNGGDHGGSYNHGYRGTGIPIPSQESRHEDKIIGEDWGDIRGRGRVRPGGYVPPDFNEDRETYTRAPHFPPNREHYPRTPANFLPVTPTPPSPHLPTHAGPTPTTSTTVAPTTSPARACTMKDYNLKTVVIPEGTTKRFLRRDSDCSELCVCPKSTRDKDPEANCIALSCVDNKTCNTSRALYPHNAPYYLAFRGVCLCYAGKFICQKPEPGDYTLGPGIYLFLGYSRGEVEILKPHTNMNEHEAVKVLESVLVRDYGFKCELTTKHHIGENFIVVAKLQVNPETYISPFVKQRREKEVCAGPLEEIAKKINSRPRHEDIRTDAILSMFVLAKVDVNLPEPHTSPSHASSLSHVTPVVYLAVLGAPLFIKALLLPAATLLT